MNGGRGGRRQGPDGDNASGAIVRGIKRQRQEEGGLGSVDVSGLKAEFERLQVTLTDRIRRLDVELRTKANSVELRGKASSGETRALQRTCGELKAACQKFTADINRSTASVDRLDREVGGLDRRLRTMEGDLVNLAVESRVDHAWNVSRLDVLDGGSAVVQGGLAYELKDQMKAFEARMEAFEAQFKVLEAQAEMFKARLRALEARPKAPEAQSGGV